MKVALGKFRAAFMVPLLVFGCAAGVVVNVEGAESRKKAPRIAMRDINDAKEAHVNELMALAGVVGVYVSALQDGTPCIKVMVVKKTPELEKQIPRSLEGHPVLIIETGEIKPLSANPRPS